MNGENATITVNEAQAILNVPVNIIYADLNNGSLPGEKISRHPSGRKGWVIEKKDLPDYQKLLEQRVQLYGTFHLPEKEQRKKKQKIGKQAIINELINMRNRLDIIILHMEEEL